MGDGKTARRQEREDTDNSLNHRHRTGERARADCRAVCLSQPLQPLQPSITLIRLWEALASLHTARSSDRQDILSPIANSR